MSKSKKRKALRPVGDIMTDLEPYLFELQIDHKMQTQELLGLFFTWSTTHVAHEVPNYEDVTLVPSLYLKDGLPYHGPLKRKKS